MAERISRSQIDKLGKRIRKGDSLSEDDLALLQQVRAESEDTLSSVAQRLVDELGWRGRIRRVKSFLIVYDRAAGRIDKFVEFSPEERDDAGRSRAELERQHRDDPNVEVVVIGSESIETLQVTHARYFKTPEQLVGG